MNKVVEFLNANPVQYLATVGRDGKAKCRPFMFAGELDGKMWFCTNNQKEVYKDMQENPYVELSVSSPKYAWISILSHTRIPSNGNFRGIEGIEYVARGGYVQRNEEAARKKRLHFLQC